MLLFWLFVGLMVGSLDLEVVVEMAGIAGVLNCWLVGVVVVRVL